MLSSQQILFPPNISQQLRLSQKAILIVDDNEVNRRIANKLISNMSDEHIEIVLAKDGEEAIAKVSERIATLKKSFDFILMDHEMPKKSGDVATLEIRELENKMQVKNSLIGSWSTTYNGCYPGANCVIKKPIQSMDLKTTLEQNGLLTQIDANKLCTQPIPQSITLK